MEQLAILIDASGNLTHAHRGAVRDVVRCLLSGLRSDQAFSLVAFHQGLEGYESGCFRHRDEADLALAWLDSVRSPGGLDAGEGCEGLAVLLGRLAFIPDPTRVLILACGPLGCSRTLFTQTEGWSSTTSLWALAIDGDPGPLQSLCQGRRGEALVCDPLEYHRATAFLRARWGDAVVSSQIEAPVSTILDLEGLSPAPVGAEKVSTGGILVEASCRECQYQGGVFFPGGHLAACPACRELVLGERADWRFLDPFRCPNCRTELPDTWSRNGKPVQDPVGQEALDCPRCGQPALSVWNGGLWSGETTAAEESRRIQALVLAVGADGRGLAAQPGDRFIELEEAAPLARGLYCEATFTGRGTARFDQSLSVPARRECASLRKLEALLAIQTFRTWLDAESFTLHDFKPLWTQLSERPVETAPEFLELIPFLRGLGEGPEPAQRLRCRAGDRSLVDYLVLLATLGITLRLSQLWNPFASRWIDPEGTTWTFDLGPGLGSTHAIWPWGAGNLPQPFIEAITYPPTEQHALKSVSIHLGETRLWRLRTSP